MAEATETRPVVDWLILPEKGEPYLEGHKCGNCGAMYLGRRDTCAKCFARDAMEAVKLSSKGELYAYTIVYRSFPGIEVPFVSCIVDLDDGTAIKGNLINIDPDPESIETGMPVEVIFGDAGRKDAAGNSYVSYFFQPAEAA